MTQITTPDFTEFPSTVTKLLAMENVRPVFYIQTERTIYKANSLQDCVQLWKISDDSSAVLNMVRQG